MERDTSKAVFILELSSSYSLRFGCIWIYFWKSEAVHALERHLLGRRVKRLSRR